jgi:hypothetical protein
MFVFFASWLKAICMDSELPLEGCKEVGDVVVDIPDVELSSSRGTLFQLVMLPLLLLRAVDVPIVVSVPSDPRTLQSS